MLGGAVGGYWKGAYKSMESRQLHSGFATDSRRIRGCSRRIRIDSGADQSQEFKPKTVVWEGTFSYFVGNTS